MPLYTAHCLGLRGRGAHGRRVGEATEAARTEAQHKAGLIPSTLDSLLHVCAAVGFEGLWNVVAYLTTCCLTLQVRYRRFYCIALQAGSVKTHKKNQMYSFCSS
jgi:hypothetical protein